MIGGGDDKSARSQKLAEPHQLQCRAARAVRQNHERITLGDS
jgi:hypothetical protein